MISVQFVVCLPLLDAVDDALRRVWLRRTAAEGRENGTGVDRLER